MESDEQTARKIAMEYAPFEHHSSELEAAIVRALQAARKEGGKQVVDEAERVSQILQSANTANADSEAKARFEVDRFAFACAWSVVGSTLTDYQKHALFHQFKNMFDSHESALRQAARTPPPGHIIDDAGVVRKVMHVSKYPGVSFLTIHSEAAEAAKDGKATKATNDKCKVCRCHISGHHGPSVGCEGCGGSCPCMLTKQEVADQ